MDCRGQPVPQPVLYRFGHRKPLFLWLPVQDVPVQGGVLILPDAATLRVVLRLHTFYLSPDLRVDSEPLRFLFQVRLMAGHLDTYNQLTFMLAFTFSELNLWLRAMRFDLAAVTSLVSSNQTVSQYGQGTGAWKASRGQSGRILATDSLRVDPHPTQRKAGLRWAEGVLHRLKMRSRTVSASKLQWARAADCPLWRGSMHGMLPPPYMLMVGKEAHSKRF